jgi:hypothetical protein
MIGLVMMEDLGLGKSNSRAKSGSVQQRLWHENTFYGNQERGDKIIFIGHERDQNHSQRELMQYMRVTLTTMINPQVSKNTQIGRLSHNYTSTRNSSAVRTF